MDFYVLISEKLSTPSRCAEQMDFSFMKILRGFGCLLLSLSLGGCFTITRTEKDLYTITQRDTTVRTDVNNAPGQRDNGTIYPSPSSVQIDRRYVQKDSVVTRTYPAFL